MLSFVYFDIGGVLIKDFSATNKWQQMRQDLGVKSSHFKTFDALWNQMVEPRVGLDYDVDNFVPVIKKRFKLNLPADYSMLDDFISRFEPNRTLWPLIQTLNINHQVGLLTNMYPRMYEAIQKAKLLPSIDWDVMIDSSVELLQKPDPKIYRLAQDRAAVPPNQILFIDNTPKNLDPAKALGWHTFYYDSADYQNSTHKLAEFIKLHAQLTN